MQAICLRQPGTIEIIDVLEPQLGAEDVLIDVRYVGLCGTDLNSYRGRLALVSYPRIPGHEVSGVIVDKGSKVPAVIQTGQAVMLSPYTACGLCPACRSGRPNCCQFNQTLGVQRDGALQERFAIHYSNVFVSDALSLRELALVEPLSVGYHAANRGRITEMDTVLVLGCGAIGIGVIVAAARKGATVIAADVDDHKLATARAFGAARTVNASTEDVPATVLALTAGEGVSVAVEAIGLPETFRAAIEAVAYAGRVVYVGYAKDPVTYDTTDFVRKELDILGARNALRVFPAVIKMLEKRERPFVSLISATYPLAETAAAFAAWDRNPGTFGKIHIVVGQNGEAGNDGPNR